MGKMLQTASMQRGGSPLTAMLASMVNSLSANEQNQRQQALQEAAQGSTGSTAGWTSHDQAPPQYASSSTAAPKVTKAHYVKKGETTNASGQKCSKVQETITMPNGKTGTSEELVCPT